MKFWLSKKEWWRKFIGGKWYYFEYDLGGENNGEYWSRNNDVLEFCEVLLKTEDYTKP